MIQTGSIERCGMILNLRFVFDSMLPHRMRGSLRFARPGWPSASRSTTVHTATRGKAAPVYSLIYCGAGGGDKKRILPQHSAVVEYVRCRLEVPANSRFCFWQHSRVISIVRVGRCTTGVFRTAGSNLGVAAASRSASYKELSCFCAGQRSC